MPDLDPPHLGEVMRRLDEMAKRQEQNHEEVKSTLSSIASTYVRQDVYLAERQMQNAVVADLRTDVTQLGEATGRELDAIKADRKTEQQQRRQLIMWLIGLTVGFLMSVAGLVVSILTLVR